MSSVNVETRVGGRRRTRGVSDIRGPRKWEARIVRPENEP
jgi:hypothetical protein